MRPVACAHCGTSVVPRADGGCPACGSPVDGSAPAAPRTVDLGPPVDPAAADRREDLRHLLLGVVMLGGGAGLLALSWVVLSGGSGLWKPIVVVAVAMMFRAVWEWWEVDRGFGASLVVALIAGSLGLPEGRGPIFFVVAAVAAVYGAHRLRRVFLRHRKDRVPAARVHGDEPG